MALFDILPFGPESDAAQLEAFFQGERFRQASTYQCLRLLKVLGGEQRHLAAHLGVTTSSVSMWMNRVRGVPEKYQEVIRIYTVLAFIETFKRRYAEWQQLPERLHLA